MAEPPGLDALLNWEFMKAIGAPYADVIGLAPFLLITLTAISGSIYIRTGSPILPLGLLLLSGAAIIPLLPAVAIQWVVLLLLIGGGGLIMLLYMQRA